MYKSLFRIACLAYSLVIRSIIQKAIADPNTDFDDIALGILDKIFDYKPAQKMLIKQGVDISRLHRHIRRALSASAKVLTLYGIEIVVTSTYEGNHDAGSLHYANDAFDIRNIGKGKESIIAGMKNELGEDYDVVNEGDHIHIEYDPKMKT